MARFSTTIPAVPRNLIPIDEMPAPIRVGGWNFFADGTKLPVVSGGDGTGESAPAGAGPPPGAPGAPAAGQPAGAPGPTPKTFTEAEVAALLAGKESETKAAESQRIATELGIPVAEAKRLITERRTADEAAKTEQQRAMDAAAQARQEADAEKAVAAALTRTAVAQIALMAPEVGVNPKHLGRAATLLLAETPADADPAAMAAAAVKLKAEMPELFGSTRAPSSDPTGRAPGSGGTDGPKGIEAGRARATADHKKSTDAYKNPFEGVSLIGGSLGGNHS